MNTILRSSITIISAAILFMCINGCQKTSDTGIGTVTGTVKTPSGKTVSGAKVCIADAEDEYFSYTDSEGNFTLEAPTGKTEVRIFTGSGKIFNTLIPVTIEDGKNLELVPSRTVLQQEKSLAFVPGANDHIERIVADSLGYRITEIFYADLADITSLQRFDVVFLNCGLHYNLSPQLYQTLNTYLQQGGNLYASDYAIHFLVGDDIQKMEHGHGGSDKTQCQSSFNGGFIPDSLLCYSKRGLEQVYVTGQVTNPALQGLLGNNLQLFYDLDSWTVLEHVELADTRFEELVTDPTNYGPLVVKIDWNNHSDGGDVLFTTFHNEANATSDMLTFLQWSILQF